jgi:hypothetical protein
MSNNISEENISTMAIKFEQIGNLEIKNIHNSIYSISFECVMVNEILNKKYKVKCHSNKSILDMNYKKVVKKSEKFNSHESHIYLDFTNLIDVSDKDIEFEILEELN